MQPATLLKRRLWQTCFPVNFAKFLRTPFLTEHIQLLLLTIEVMVDWVAVFDFLSVPGLTSTSLLSITRRLKGVQIQSRKNWTIGKLEYRRLWWILKHFSSIKTGRKDKCKIEVKNKLNHIWTNCLTISKLENPQISTFYLFLVVKSAHCHSMLRQINWHPWKLETGNPPEQKPVDKSLSVKLMT